MSETPTSSGPAHVEPSAVIEEGVSLGAGCRVWHHCHIRTGSDIGAATSLGKNVFVDSGVSVGRGVHVQNNVSIYRGVHLGDDVFVGPSVVFTNDKVPRAGNVEWDPVHTHVERGCSIGANSTIVCGVTLGAWSMVGAGSVVTKSVAAHALVVGNPARLTGWVCRCGHARALPDSASLSCTHCGTDLQELTT